MDSSIVVSLANWIASTRLSDVFKENLWVVPTSQSIHIVSLAVVFTCALVIGLRMLAVGRSERMLSAVVSKHTRMMYAGLVVLLFTGGVQTIAEPLRQFASPAFWIKMMLIIFGLLLTWLLVRSVHRDPDRWNSAELRPGWSRFHGVIYITAWSAIIFSGRFIGYT